MERIIKSIDEKHYLEALDFVKKVFTDSEGLEPGALEHIKGFVSYEFYEALR